MHAAACRCVVVVVVLPTTYYSCSCKGSLTLPARARGPRATWNLKLARAFMIQYIHREIYMRMCSAWRKDETTATIIMIHAIWWLLDRRLCAAVDRLCCCCLPTAAIVTRSQRPPCHILYLLITRSTMHATARSVFLSATVTRRRRPIAS